MNLDGKKIKQPMAHQCSGHQPKISLKAKYSKGKDIRSPPDFNN